MEFMKRINMMKMNPFVSNDQHNDLDEEEEQIEQEDEAFQDSNLKGTEKKGNKRVRRKK